MKKRILSILFAACLLMTAIPVSAAEVLPTPEAVSESTPTIAPEEQPTLEGITEELPTPEIVPEEQPTPESIPEEQPTPESAPEVTVTPEAIEMPEEIDAPLVDQMQEETETPAALETPDITPSPTVMPVEDEDQLPEFSEEDVTVEYGVGPAYKGIYTEEDARAIFADNELVTATTGSLELKSDEEVIDYVKSQMKARNTSFSFSLSYSWGYGVEDMIYAAMDEKIAKSSDEGDYILAHVKTYKVQYNSRSFSFQIEYMSTASQEAEVALAVRNALASLSLDGKSEYEKLEAIHDYIVNHVDYVNDGTNTCHSAYGAIVNRQAVCQGYASLFYRMCREAGIPVRYITGEAGEAHAWNIVKMGDYWYNVDTTWDDPIGGSPNQGYFLKSDADFADHWRDSQYRSGSFYNEHPMAPVSWSVLNTEPLNCENIVNTSIQNIDGGTLSTQSEGKPKLLVFFRTGCGNSQSTLRSFANSEWVKNGQADVYALEIDGSTLGVVENFRDTYCGGSNIKFGYNSAYRSELNSLMWSYAYLGGFSGSVPLPVIAMVDSNGLLQFVVKGYQSAEGISAGYLPRLQSGYVPPEEETYPVTRISIRNYSSAQYVGSSLYSELGSGRRLNMNAGDVIYVNGVGQGWHSALRVDPRTTVQVSDGGVISYDAASCALTAVGGGTAVLTFTSVSNPEVSAVLNITVQGTAQPTPKPSAGPAGKIFKDVAPGSWMEKDINFVYEKGIMNGVGNGENFAPEDKLTRSMFATVLYRIAGEPPVSYRNVFNDVLAGQWYSKAVVWAYDAGIVNGKGSGNYGPDDNITREQVATMLLRFAEKQGYPADVRADLSSFDDQASVNGWARDGFCWASGNGIITGIRRNGRYYLNPQGNASRAECAVMLGRFIRAYME